MNKKKMIDQLGEYFTKKGKVLDLKEEAEAHRGEARRDQPPLAGWYSGRARLRERGGARISGEGPPPRR